MTEPLPEPDASPAPQWWRWLLLLAAALVPLILAACGADEVLLLFSAVAIFPLLIASGIMQLLLAFILPERRSLVLHLLAAALSVPAGFQLIFHPAVSAVAVGLILVTLLLATALLWLVPLSRLAAADARTGAAVGSAALMVTAAALTWGHGIVLGFLFVWMALDLFGHGLVWVILGPVVEMPPRKPSTPSAAPEPKSETLNQPPHNLRQREPAPQAPAAARKEQ